MQPAIQSSNQPLGGSSGAWRHRLLLFHLPLALASAVVLILFMSLPFFDANLYPRGDIISGLFPQPRDEGEALGHGEDPAGSSSHSGGHSGTTGRGGDHSGSTGHGGDQATGHTPNPDETGIRFSIRRLTVGTGYVALGLLALTLLLGPANILLRKRNPVSSYLRRDVGTWTAIFSIVHVIFGLLVHSSGQLRNFLDYFIAPDGRLLTNSFGLGNWTGLAALVIAAGLLAISSDFALRTLKAGPWKWLQRLNYVLFALVILHAFFYGALLRMNSPFTLLLFISVSMVFIGQMVGVWLWRRRHTRLTTNPI